MKVLGEWTFSPSGKTGNSQVVLNYFHLFFEDERKCYGFKRTRGLVNDFMNSQGPCHTYGVS